MAAKQKPEPDELERAIYDEFIRSVRRLAGDAELLAEQVTELLNRAYLQGAADCRKAITGRDPKVAGGDDE